MENRNMKLKKGVTLLELLIAAMIMAMATMAMVDIFKNAFRVFTVTVSDIRGAQDAMFVFDELNSKFRMAVRPGWDKQKTLVAPLSTKVQFFNTTGSAPYSDNVLTTQSANDAVLMNLTTYRSNDETSDNTQKYGVFIGDLESIPNHNEIYIYSEKDRGNVSTSTWEAGGCGAIATFTSGMMFEVYSSFDFTDPTNCNYASAASATSSLSFNDANFEDYRGVKTVVWVKREVATKNGIEKISQALHCLTSIRYKDWQDWPWVK
ncbi:MAG: prepilin-type N-terminal cleavage/methylation domain-containing protein [Bacteroidales bacterium]|nr:prepilin-type N-terminal cleavage/methylation domain-containing protein [Bacteroidales bacterium]